MIFPFGKRDDVLEEIVFRDWTVGVSLFYLSWSAQIWIFCREGNLFVHRTYCDIVSVIQRLIIHHISHFSFARSLTFWLIHCEDCICFTYSSRIVETTVLPKDRMSLGKCHLTQKYPRIQPGCGQFRNMFCMLGFANPSLH